MIKLYPQPDLFLNACQTLLEQREEANNLMLGIVLRLRDHPEQNLTPTYLAAVQPGWAAHPGCRHDPTLPPEPDRFSNACRSGYG